jgi:protein-S-isoprenylcysteine O-methyltransferase Ste14
MNTTERRSRISAGAGSAIFFLIAPGTVGVLVPRWISGWRVHASFPGSGAIRIAGVVLIAIGAAILLECFGRFVMEGFGTPAPIYPTRHLVVRGWYRFVRNPMYVAVLAVILGQALLFLDSWLVLYGFGCWLVTHCFVIGYEEPTLLRSFPEEYKRYREHVPRWIPRLTPWKGQPAS